MPVALALIDDAANGLGIERAADAVHDDLADRDLAFDWLVACFEINRGGHAAQFALAELVLGEAAEQCLRLVRREACVLEKAGPFTAATEFLGRCPGFAFKQRILRGERREEQFRAGQRRRLHRGLGAHMQRIGLRPRGPRC